MTDEEKIKIQNSLLFHQSDVWDSVMSIIDELYRSEVVGAISSGVEESKRSHQCGRADGVAYVKELLESTREQALINSKRKNS